MKKRAVIIGVIVFLILVIVIAGGLFFFSKTKCETSECFYSSLIKCERASFVNENKEIVMLYDIAGKSKDSCVVNVRLLQVKKGDVKLQDMENYDMDCYVQLGSFGAPEADMKNCHGILKEMIQEEVISRMHKQIIENLGQINSNISKVI